MIVLLLSDIKKILFPIVAWGHFSALHINISQIKIST